MKERFKKFIIISAVTLAVGCAYALFVIKTGVGFPCPFHLLTGLNCPGCGATRMCLSLLKFDLASAFSANAGLLCMCPILLIMFVIWSVRYIRTGQKTFNKPWNALSCCMLILLLLWGAARNLIGI